MSNPSAPSSPASSRRRSSFSGARSSSATWSRAVSSRIRWRGRFASAAIRASRSRSSGVEAVRHDDGALVRAEPFRGSRAEQLGRSSVHLLVRHATGQQLAHLGRGEQRALLLDRRGRRAPRGRPPTPRRSGAGSRASSGPPPTGRRILQRTEMLAGRSACPPRRGRSEDQPVRSSAPILTLRGPSDSAIRVKLPNLPARQWQWWSKRANWRRRRRGERDSASGR